MKLKKQKGFSLLNLALAIVFIGFFGLIGFQIGMGYLDQSAIKSSVKQSLINAQNDDTMKANDIVKEIVKQAGLNSIDLPKDNVFVTRIEGQNYSVSIEHTKVIKLTEKITIVMNLDFSEESK